MSDSIDLLEAVGGDASLRHLPPNELAIRLRAAGASEALACAAIQRDGGPLSKEFGTRVMQEPNSGHFPFRDAPTPPLQTPSQDEEEDADGSDGGQQALSAAANTH
ncbi:hypothetical protein [Luteibacter aegosomatissinici]|uniref:hypothetical protein n=1 Tax=Luteibacter aegosomatissinici TaxID=2911539 RepID=UPI001FFA48BC|nr:hypothetical protein [Luteibacter aegosomatissinici]UPG95111.1 hypothetical protein L2Y97_03110 [Luteibacter aegosomatissinici]